MTSMGAVATVVLLSLCFCAAVEARVFATCWLMWEGPDDLGYTYTFNQNRRALDTMLAARYPSFVIESYAATNVGSMTSDQANATVFDFIQNKQCNVILSADTYLLPYVYYEDGGTTLATMYPNVSWILIDDFRMPTRSGLPNLIWGSGSWGPPNWIAGVTAAVQAANDAVCFVSAYEDGVLSAPEAANAFILGVRAINRSKPVMLMTMNNWYWPGAEELAVSLLNKNGCRVVARYTDARLIDIWVKNHPESGMLSIGAHSDVGAYVGDSVMMSALEDNTQLIDLFVTIIETGTIGSGYFPLLLNPIFTPLSPDASVAAHTAYTWAVANAPDPNHIICGARKLRRGETVNYTQANGCLSVLERPTEYIYDAGTTYYTFANGLDCPNGTYYEYSFPDLTMTCYPCPANTYRPPEQTAAGTSCTPCPQGFISAPGATICTQPHSSSSVADVWYAFLIAGLVVVGAIAVMAARQYRAYAVFAVRPLDPDTAFAVCFLGLKNEHELQELGETNMQAALEKLNGMIRSAARKHGCFEARRIDAGTVMVVGKSATDLVLFTETVMEQVVALDWRNMVFVDLQGPAGKKRHSRIVAHSTTESTHSKHSMSKRSQHSPAQSARLKHQPQQDQVSVRSGTPSTSTRRSTALDLEAIVPTIYAGVHFGTAQIVVDDEQHTVSYHGHTITAAAGIADAAVAGQILLSSDAVEAVALESMSGKLTGSFVSSGTRMEMSVVTYQSARLSEKHHRKVAAAAARSSASEEGVLGNAIARAEGRLMRRRVAVISCHVPQLARDMRSDDRALLEAHAVIEELAEVAAANFGAVQSVQDGLVTITIGVDKAVSLLSSRAAAIAHEVEHLCSAIGMHMTVAVVGRSASGGTSILGHVASVASVMRLMAADSKVKVITTGACYGDLYPTHFLATVDALLLPWDLSGKPTRVVALRGLRESGQEDDEWLYRFDREMAAESGWTHVVEGREVTPAELEAIQSSPISFVPRSDDVAAANEPDAALLLGKKTLVDLLTTTTDNALAKPLAHRLRERTEARLSSIASHALSQSLPLF